MPCFNQVCEIFACGLALAASFGDIGGNFGSFNLLGSTERGRLRYFLKMRFSIGEVIFFRRNRCKAQFNRIASWQVFRNFVLAIFMRSFDGIQSF
jgi:hypothetical protein